MAKPLSADRMLAALKAEGLTVHEHSGWRTHNRAGHGAWGPVHGVLIHHTAGHGDRELCYRGRSDLPGPLCHAWVGKTAGLWTIGNGRANHAGLADATVLNQVIHESYGTRPSKPGAGTVDGNAMLYGLEIENLGNGTDPYPAGQYDQAVRWAAAICRAHGWDAKSVIGHKESTNQKIDPSFDMPAFRVAVAERLRHHGSWSPTSEEDDDMPIRTSLGKSAGQKAPWSTWTAVAWDVEHADPEKAHAGSNHPGYVSPTTSWADFGGRLVLDGLRPGDQLQIEYQVHDGKDGGSVGVWREIIADQPCTPGKQFVSVPFSKGLAEGQHVYVAVMPIPGEGRADEPAPSVTGGRWTVRQDRG